MKEGSPTLHIYHKLELWHPDEQEYPPGDHGLSQFPGLPISEKRTRWANEVPTDDGRVYISNVLVEIWQEAIRLSFRLGIRAFTPCIS